MTAAPAPIYIPDLPPHVLKALRLMGELAEAKRISTVEWETVTRAIVRRVPGDDPASGYTLPGWSPDDIIASSLQEVGS